MTTSTTEKHKESKEITALKANVLIWSKRAKSLQQEYVKGNQDNKDEVLVELDALDKFLAVKIPKRLEEIAKFPPEFQEAYARFIEPFLTEQGLPKFISTYFDVEVFKQVRLRYRKKSPFEKEVCLLFDLYKIKKTLETISTLFNAIKAESKDSFPSLFSPEDQKEFLKVFWEILKFFMARFLKKDTRQAAYEVISGSGLTPGYFTEMRKQGVSYTPDGLMEGSEYRDKFITLFFSTLMKIKINGEMKEMHFNYLNFEIIKNEFLLNWMNKKLQGQPCKDEIYKKYKIGGRSIADLIKENPEKEAEYLKSIPLEEFRNMAEELNSSVSEELQAAVPTFSSKFGPFAKISTAFVQVKQMARFSLEKMQEAVPKGQIWTVMAKPKKKESPERPVTIYDKNKSESNLKPVTLYKKDKEQEAPVEAPQKEEPKIEKLPYGLEVVPLQNIDFAFFDKKTETYPAKLEFLKKKLGTEYDSFRQNVWNLINIISREQIIIRFSPHQEWVIPFRFEKGSEEHTLLIGANISMLGQKSGYQSKWSDALFEFIPYFIYGSHDQEPKYGEPSGARTIGETVFYTYPWSNQQVLKRGLELFGWINQNITQEMFTTSNFKKRGATDVFPELQALRQTNGIRLEPTGEPLPKASEEEMKEIETKQSLQQPKSIDDIAKDLKKELNAQKQTT